MAINTDAVQRLYVAYFNRPSDPIGQAYWESKLPATAATQAQLTTLAAGFSGSAEYAALYAGQSNAQIVNNLYLNLFGRAAEPAGLTSWASALTAGTQTFASIALQLTYSAQGTDATAIANKLAAANAFTAALDTTAEITGYSGTAAAASARTWLATVTDVASTLTSATATTTLSAAVTAATAAGTSSTGTTFTLTTGIDTLTGTSANDTFNGLSADLGALDTVTGGDGTDTLNLASGAAFTVIGAKVTSIETLNVTTTGGTGIVTLSGVTGLTTLGSVNSTSATTFGVAGAAAGSVAAVGALNVSNTATATTVIYTEAAVAGTADNVALGVSGVTGAAAINIDTQTANAVGVEKVTITSSGSVANSITLATIDTAGLANVTVLGSTAITVALGTNVTTTATTIDASAATGGVTISGFGAVADTVTGGTGADRFQFGANLGTTDVVNGGAGVDMIAANGAVLAAFTSSSKPTLSNLEGVELADDVGTTATTIDASLFGTINNVRIADQATTGAAVVTYNNLTAAATGSNNIRIDGDLGATGGLYTFNITDATTGGTANAVTVDLRGAVATATSTLAMAGVETVTIDSTNATGASTFNLTDTALTSLTVLGGQSVSLNGATLGAGVTTVNASGLTGAAAINVALNVASVAGATVTGGAGADTIVGSQLADTINGGAGNDTITGGLGLDVLTGGAGADTFSFVGTAGTTNDPILGNFDTITDFVVGTDLIQISGVTDVVSVQQTAVQTAVTALAAGSTAAQIATAMALANTTNLADSFATFGGDTYVLFETAGANTTFTVADDIFIKLSGVTTIPTFANGITA